MDKKQYTDMYIIVLSEKNDKHLFFLQIVVLMAILAVCAAYPQSIFDFFNPFYYLSLFTAPFTTPKPTNSSSTAAGTTTAATSKTTWTTTSGKLACTKSAGIQILLLLKIYKSLVLSCYYMQLLFKTAKTNNVAGIIKLIP